MFNIFSQEEKQKLFRMSPIHKNALLKPSGRALENPEWNWLSRKHIRLNNKLGDVGKKDINKKVLALKSLVTHG